MESGLLLAKGMASPHLWKPSWSALGLYMGLTSLSLSLGGHGESGLMHLPGISGQQQTRTTVGRRFHAQFGPCLIYIEARVSCCLYKHSMALYGGSVEFVVVEMGSSLYPWLS